MEPLTWTGILGAWLNPVLWVAAAAFAVALVLYLLVGLVAPASDVEVNPDGTLAVRMGPRVMAALALRAAGSLLGLVLLAYVVGGIALPWGAAGIVGCIAKRFLPVWIALAVTFAVSIAYKRKLGLYGRLFDSTIGMIGFGLVMFWLFTAIAAGVFDLIATHDPLTAISGLKNKPPGVPVPGAEVLGPGSHYLLGGDALARDVFSRMVHGAWVVIQIAPLATVFAFMVGITLGLPAGYFGGRLDTLISFLANLILAFPVILLFYLLVTPEMIQTGIPSFMAVGLFIFPLIFTSVLIWSRFHTQRQKAVPMLAVSLFVLGWLYLSLISQTGTPIAFMGPLDLFDIPSGAPRVFVSVVFVNSPRCSASCGGSPWTSRRGTTWRRRRRGGRGPGTSCSGRSCPTPGGR
ncbi:Dipeptide transport system permease protein DppC [Rubellimicrobium mesophilum DSM 19309]|uniref:Dipeptide transport system permease protein DppC n=1 Tax=Rubellimicrobium mesophilum DSM 19309 TaxID=442562 RepID=A0A017HRW8_9RHOB|nr:Dipeptide transport system permease protein DppC [Rubellimicrobium mesophilum DSM 19309]